jgi:MmyB-like transcription regulator ligand binding domain
LPAVFSEMALDTDEMRPVKRALHTILSGHEPYPAVIVDREWEIVASNRPAQGLLQGVSEELVAPPANALRITLHPRTAWPLASSTSVSGATTC